jgi:O-antigen/teichoic acid export membrane protein
MTNNFKTILGNKKRNYIVFSQVATAILSLIFGKLIAMYVQPAEFGLFNLQFGIFTLLFTLCFAPTTQYYKSTITSLYTKIGFEYYGISLGLSTLLVACGLTIYLVFVQTESTSFIGVLAILIFIPLNALFKIKNDYNNVVNNYKKFVTGNILKTLTTVIAAFFLFTYFSSDIRQSEKLWLIQIISFTVGIFFLFNIKALKIKKIRFFSYRKFLNNQLIFGFPLIFTAILSWLNNYIDRYIIDYFLDLSEVGIYNANYSLGSKFFLLLSPIFLILLSPKVYSNSPLKNKKALINKYFLVFSGLAIFILVILGFTYNMIGEVLLSQTYSEGFNIIFWIAIAHFFLVATTLFESLFYSEKFTKFILYGNLVAAIINIALNILLIPILGIFGAAIATVLSFLSRFIYIYLKFERT